MVRFTSIKEFLLLVVSPPPLPVKVVAAIFLWRRGLAVRANQICPATNEGGVMGERVMAER